MYNTMWVYAHLVSDRCWQHLSVLLYPVGQRVIGSPHLFFSVSRNILA